MKTNCLETLKMSLALKANMALQNLKCALETARFAWRYLSHINAYVGGDNQISEHLHEQKQNELRAQSR